MDPACLINRLSDEEREFFLREGYLVVEGALSPEQVRTLAG